jgi:hypothetical protein
MSNFHIGIDISNAQKSIKTIKQELSDVADVANKTSKKISAEFDRCFDNMTNRLKNYSTAVQNSGNVQTSQSNVHGQSSNTTATSRSVGHLRGFTTGKDNVSDDMRSQISSQKEIIGKQLDIFGKNTKIQLEYLDLLNNEGKLLKERIELQTKAILENNRLYHMEQEREKFIAKSIEMEKLYNKTDAPYGRKKIFHDNYKRDLKVFNAVSETSDGYELLVDKRFKELEIEAEAKKRFKRLGMDVPTVGGETSGDQQAGFDNKIIQDIVSSQKEINTYLESMKTVLNQQMERQKHLEIVLDERFELEQNINKQIEKDLANKKKKTGKDYLFDRDENEIEYYTDLNKSGKYGTGFDTSVEKKIWQKTAEKEAMASLSHTGLPSSINDQIIAEYRKRVETIVKGNNEELYIYSKLQDIKNSLDAHLQANEKYKDLIHEKARIQADINDQIKRERESSRLEFQKQSLSENSGLHTDIASKRLGINANAQNTFLSSSEGSDLEVENQILKDNLNLKKLIKNEEKEIELLLKKRELANKAEEEYLSRNEKLEVERRKRAIELNSIAKDQLEDDNKAYERKKKSILMTQKATAELKKQGKIAKQIGEGFWGFFDKVGIRMSGLAATLFVFQQISSIVTNISEKIDEINNSFDEIGNFAEGFSEKDLFGAASQSKSYITETNQAMTQLMKNGLSYSESMEKLPTIFKLAKNSAIELEDAVKMSLYADENQIKTWTNTYQATKVDRKKEADIELKNSWAEFLNIFGDDVEDLIVGIKKDVTNFIRNDGEELRSAIKGLIKSFELAGKAIYFFASIPGKVGDIAAWMGGSSVFNESEHAAINRAQALNNIGVSDKKLLLDYRLGELNNLPALQKQALEKMVSIYEPYRDMLLSFKNKNESTLKTIKDLEIELNRARSELKKLEEQKIDKNIPTTVTYTPEEKFSSIQYYANAVGARNAYLEKGELSPDIESLIRKKIMDEIGEFALTEEQKEAIVQTNLYNTWVSAQKPLIEGLEEQQKRSGFMSQKLFNAKEKEIERRFELEKIIPEIGLKRAEARKNRNLFDLQLEGTESRVKLFEYGYDKNEPLNKDSELYKELNNLKEARIALYKNNIPKEFHHYLEPLMEAMDRELKLKTMKPSAFAEELFSAKGHFSKVKTKEQREFELGKELYNIESQFGSVPEEQRNKLNELKKDIITFNEGKSLIGLPESLRKDQSLIDDFNNLLDRLEKGDFGGLDGKLIAIDTRIDMANDKLEKYQKFNISGDKMSQGDYALQVKLNDLKKKRDILESDGSKESLARINEFYKDVAQELKSNFDETMWEDFKDGYTSVLKEMERESFNTSKNMKRIWESVGDSISNAISSSIMDLVNNDLKTFDDYLQSIANSILSVFSNIVSQQMTTGFMKMFNFAGANANGNTGLSGGFQAFANGSPIVSKPTLGLVGEGRYDEAIVPLPDNKHIPVVIHQKNSSEYSKPMDIKVNIKNESGEQISAEQSGGIKMDANSMVCEIVLKAIKNNKFGMRETIRGVAK